jgi:hypothetical protein
MTLSIPPCRKGGKCYASITKARRPGKRKDNRYSFSRYVLYVTEKGVNQGNLVDYSNGGVYITTQRTPNLGSTLIVAPPYSKDKNEKRKGMGVRTDDKGFAVEFFKDPETILFRTDLM